MVDSLSVAASAAGLVSLSFQLLGGCIQGFVLLTTAHNLGKDASTVICKLNIEELRLVEWAKRAGLLTGNGTLDHRLNPAAIEYVLHQIRDLLNDSKELESRYKLSYTHQKPQNYQAVAVQDSNLSEQEKVFTSISQGSRDEILKRAGIAQSSNFIKRVWWAAVDKKKLENLVEDVRALIQGLWNYLDPYRGDDMEYLLRLVLSETSKTKQSVEHLSAMTETFIKAGLRGIATATELKALKLDLEQNQGKAETDGRAGIRTRQEALKKVERLSHQKLTSVAPLKKNPNMALATYDGESVFVEWKQVDPALRNKILPRVENLAALLSVDKDESFQSLRCNGFLEDGPKWGFVFQHPNVNQTTTEPKSLLDLFSAKGGIDPPSLTDRIRLALRITQVVRNFHRTGWLHKGLRSENILFFNTTDLAAAVRTTDFVLAGFNFARLSSPTEISEQPSADPKHDIYRHPSALGQPSVSFNESMDVYSLGTMLLEIAEWRALRYLVDSVVDVGAESVPLDKLAAIRPYLLSGQGKGGTSKLRVKMGDVYASVCLMCLRGDVDGVSKDSQVDGVIEESVIDIAVRRLQRCHI